MRALCLTFRSSPTTPTLPSSDGSPLNLTLLSMLTKRQVCLPTASIPSCRPNRFVYLRFFPCPLSARSFCSMPRLLNMEMASVLSTNSLSSTSTLSYRRHTPPHPPLNALDVGREEPPCVNRKKYRSLHAFIRILPLWPARQATLLPSLGAHLCNLPSHFFSSITTPHFALPSLTLSV